MKAIEYIKKSIDKIVSDFPLIKLSYQFDGMTDTHFVEVLPKVYFEKYDFDFITAQNSVIIEFIDHYPSENLSFITKDDFFIVDDPLYCKAGDAFNSESISQLSDVQLSVSEILSTYEALIPDSFILEQRVYGKGNNSQVFEFNLVSDHRPDETLNSTSKEEDFFDNSYKYAA